MRRTMEMATYSNGIETKRLLITATYQLIMEKDVSEIHIRDIARMSGCTHAAIYHHFETMEYLIVISSMRILDTYMEEYGELLDRNLDPVTTYIEAWKLFDRHAFKRPDVFFRLFWGSYTDAFESAVQEYNELFPYEARTINTAYFYILFFTGDLQERDFMALRNVVNANLITLEDARYLSKVDSWTCKGMIQDSIPLDADERDRMRLECDEIIERGVNNALERTALSRGRKNP